MEKKKNYSGSILERYLDSVHYCFLNTVPDYGTMVLAGFNHEHADPFKN